MCQLFVGTFFSALREHSAIYQVPMAAKKNSKKTAKAAQSKPVNAKDPKSGQPKRSRDVPVLTDAQRKTQQGLRSCSLSSLKDYLRFLRVNNRFDKSESEITSCNMDRASAYAAAHAHVDSLSPDDIRLGPSKWVLPDKAGGSGLPEHVSDERGSERDADAVRALAARFDVLSGQVASLADKAGGDSGVADLTAQVKDLAGLVATLAKNGAPPPTSTPDLTAQVKDLAGQVASLAKNGAPPPTSGVGTNGTLSPPLLHDSSTFDQKVSSVVDDPGLLAIYGSWPAVIKAAYSLGRLVPLPAFAAKSPSDAVLNAFKPGNAFTFSTGVNGMMVPVPTTSASLKPITSQDDFLTCLAAKDGLDLCLKPAKSVANAKDRECIMSLLTYIPWKDVLDWYATQNVSRHRIDPASGRPIPFVRLGPPSSTQTNKWTAESLARNKAAPVHSPGPRPSAARLAAPSPAASSGAARLPQKEYDNTKRLALCLRFQKGPCPRPAPHDERRFAGGRSTSVSVEHKCGRCEEAGHGVSTCPKPPL